MNRSSEPQFVLLTGLSLVLLIIPWILGGAFAPEEGLSLIHISEPTRPY